MPQPPTGTLTFLFTDIEGSTARWETQREAMAAALVRHDALLRGVIEGHGGTVFKTVGDAFCAVFADAEAALGAAMDAQRALAAEPWTAFGAEFEGLRDVVKAPQTAEALDARDRIIVSDPNAAEGAEDEGSQTVVVQRDVPETLAAILAVIRGDERSLVLTVPQVIAAARHRPADLTAYRLGRVAEWSQPRYRLDGRFVALTLLIDQGEDAAGGRWAANQERYDDLGKLLAGVPDPAVVVLGPPGSGKSPLLRHLELDTAIAGLRGEEAKGDGASGQDRAQDTVTFFIQLNQYKARAGHPLADPGEWLAAEWAGRYPDLPSLDTLLSEGRMVLLLDALNEMPAASEREYRERVGLWKDWLLRLTQTRPGNRVVFSCRSLDYSAPLSTPALRVPQVQIEPLTDAQVEAFLKAYSPVRGGEIWT